MPLLAPRTAMRIGHCLRRAPSMGQSRESVEGSWTPCRRDQCRRLISKVVPGVREGKMDGQGGSGPGIRGTGRFLKVLTAPLVGSRYHLPVTPKSAQPPSSTPSAASKDMLVERFQALASEVLMHPVHELVGR